MRFVHPEYLYFLLFAIVPVVLYFFNLQRTIRVDFSNVHMLEDIKRKTSNRFQLKKLLVLISRILFVVFVVGVFAQPTFKEGKDLGAKHHVLYLDNSLSMTRIIDSRLLLDHAKASLQDLLPSTKGHKFSFMTNDDQRLSLDFYSKKEFLKEISDVKSTPYTSDFLEVKNAFRRKKSDLPKQFYLLSDFQKSYFSQMEEEAIEISKDDKLTIVKYDAGVDNAFIDSVWINSKYLVAGNQVAINFRCVNRSSEINEVLVKCLIDGSQVGSKIVQILDGEVVVDELSLQIPKNGFNSCVLVVEDSDVTFDNSYNFVVEANKSIKVLVVKGKDMSYFESSYMNEPLFKVKSVKEDGLNSSELEGTDLLVLESLVHLENLPIQQLKEFVADGGYIAVVPSKVTSVSNYLQFVRRLNVNVNIKEGNSSKERLDFTSIDDLDLFENVFESSGEKIQGGWFMSRFQFSGGSSLLKSRKGNSLLKSFNVGKGKMFLFSTGFEANYTDVHRHSLFVPTSYQIAMSSSHTNENLAFNITKEELVVESVNAKEDENYMLVSNENQYMVEQQVQGKNLNLFLLQNEEAGFYDLRTKEDVLTRIALNYDRKESDFDPLDLSSLNNSDNIEVMNLDILKSESFDSGSVDIHLWKWMICLALVSLVFETSLIKFFK